MYPGGSVCKIFQFIRRENDDGYPSYGLNTGEREESPCVPFWFPDRKSGYIQGVQSGFIGPVVSFYQRMDSKRYITRIQFTGCF